MYKRYPRYALCIRTCSEAHMVYFWRALFRSLFLTLATTTLGIVSTAAQPRGVTYTAIELVTLADQGVTQVVRALNDSDEVVGGGRRGPGSDARAFYLTRRGFDHIVDLPGSDYSTAFGINTVGE